MRQDFYILLGLDNHGQPIVLEVVEECPVGEVWEFWKHQHSNLICYYHMALRAGVGVEEGPLKDISEFGFTKGGD